MENIYQIQTAIDYIEEHLLEDINYQDVAHVVYCSSFHLHRMFSLITGMTINEYIKNRRLSSSGIELSSTNQKVIDVAYKYGYETPESFTKAFKRFHGITPINAKKRNIFLKIICTPKN